MRIPLSVKVSCLRSIFLTAGFSIGGSLVGAAPQKLATGFDDLKLGDLPTSWTSGYLGETGKPHWHVAADPTASSAPNVLKQDGKAPYMWLVAPAFKASQGAVECRFRVESGKEDPEAGLIARFIDGRNYAYVRANVLENDIIFYRMIDGKKEVVKTVPTPVAAKQWHKLRVEFKEQGYKVYFDGKEVMGLVEARLKGPGSVGLWTTADTVSVFDDFEAMGE